MFKRICCSDGDEPDLQTEIQKGSFMSPWLTLAIGVILGLLLGWVIELLNSRRSRRTESFNTMGAGTRAPEWTVPRPAASTASEPVSSGVAAASAAAMRASGSHQEGQLDVPPGSRTGELSLDEPQYQEVDWPEVSERVAEVGRDVDLPGPGRVTGDVELPAVPAEPPDINTPLPEINAHLPAVYIDLSEEHTEQYGMEGEMSEAPPGEVTPETSRGLSQEALDALAPAAATHGDNLLRIEGIGKTYDARLRAAGITTFAQLIGAGEVRLHEIIQPQTWQRVNFGEWIEQARLMMEGNEEELQRLQARLFNRKK